MLNQGLFRSARSSALLLVLPFGLAVHSSGAMAAWQTLVVGPGDTVTSLFSRQDIALRDLASLTKNATVARKLRTLRVGDVVEVQRESGRRLAGLRVHTGADRLSAVPHGTGWKVATARISKTDRLALLVRKADIALSARDASPVAGAARAADNGDVSGPADRVRELETALLTVLERAMGTAAAPEAAAPEATTPEATTPEATTPETAAAPSVAATSLTGTGPTQATAEETGTRVVVGLEDRFRNTDTRTKAAAKRGALPLAGQVRLAERSSHSRRLVVAPPVLVPLEPVPTAVIAKARSQGRSLARQPALVMEVRRAERSMQRRRQAFNRSVPGLDDPRVRRVLAGARGHIGVPYLWGGNSPDSGFDCSGFVVYHLKRVGVRIPRTAHQQFLHTKTAPVARNRLAPGDLVFFRDASRPGRIGHVGIYIGKDRFIHAVGDNKPVQITPMSRPHYAKRFVRGGRILG